MEDISSGVIHEDELLWSPTEEEAGRLLSFDDDYWAVWRRYFDLFDSYNAKVTFFVQGKLEEPEDDDTFDAVLAAYVAENNLEGFCVEALRRGHGLGFHTVNHLDLRRVSREVFNRETIEAAAAFHKKGIIFSAMAYPFGFSEPWMHETLAPFFSVTRGYGTNLRFYDTEISSNGFLVSTAIDNTIYPNTLKFENDMRRILLAAKFTGHCVVPFTTHDISDGAQWGITQKRLEYLLQTAHDLKLRFYTYDAFQYLFPRH
jgi:peptidoglycan/xylan/chitin deacetylase (PgdA/CDA1 family)